MESIQSNSDLKSFPLKRKKKNRLKSFVCNHQFQDGYCQICFESYYCDYDKRILAKKQQQQKKSPFQSRILRQTDLLQPCPIPFQKTCNFWVWFYEWILSLPTTFWDPYEERGTSILFCFSWAPASHVELQIHLKVSDQDSSLVKSECLRPSFVVPHKQKRLQFLREPFYLCLRTLRRLCWVSTASCAFQSHWPSSETQIPPCSGCREHPEPLGMRSLTSDRFFSSYVFLPRQMMISQGEWWRSKTKCPHCLAHQGERTVSILCLNSWRQHAAVTGYISSPWTLPCMLRWIVSYTTWSSFLFSSGWPSETDSLPWGLPRKNKLVRRSKCSPLSTVCSVPRNPCSKVEWFFWKLLLRPFWMPWTLFLQRDIP